MKKDYKAPLALNALVSTWSHLTGHLMQIDLLRKTPIITDARPITARHLKTIVIYWVSNFKNVITPRHLENNFKKRIVTGSLKRLLTITASFLKEPFWLLRDLAVWSQVKFPRLCNLTFIKDVKFWLHYVL